MENKQTVEMKIKEPKMVQSRKFMAHRSANILEKCKIMEGITTHQDLEIITQHWVVVDSEIQTEGDIRNIK